jgi:hypothetical protein
MTGIPDWNFPTFHATAKKLRDAGHEVFNPAETDNGDTTKPWEYYMRKDLAMLCAAEAVAVLPGWQKSRGANLEVSVAESVGLPILDADTLQPYREPITLEAHRIVNGGRQDAYGHPFHDFNRIASLWSAVLGSKVTAQQVALCMIQVKVSRECNKPKRDNAVDIAGYAEALDMVNSYTPE